MPPSPQGEGFYAQSVPTDAKAERGSPLPSSGLRGTPDATLPSRGGILRAARFDGRKNGTSSAPKSFPSRGRCRRRRRKRCRTGSQFVSTDAEAERKSPLPSSGLRGTPDATLPSRGGILRAARSDGRKNGTSSTQSFPLRGRCRRRRRKRCRTGSQFVSTDEKAERGSPLPSSGLRGTPDATLPSRGGILRAVRSDGRRSGTKITSSVIRLAGDAGCHPPLKGRDCWSRSPARPRCH